MSYNKQYNTRHSGRYNTPGQFVSAGEVAPPPPPPTSFAPPPPAPRKHLTTQHQQNLQNLQMIQLQSDVDANSEQMDMDSTKSEEGSTRPAWMKTKLGGVKKISNKERRRRQNENLRRLLTPKNALMVLNEMLPNEQLANQQFKVEPASQAFYKANNTHSFCADLTLEGNTYKGYGENKLTARNAAAEQAIRDLIIKRMTKALTAEASGSQNGEAMEGTEGGAGGEEEALPMIQLASFALHKLFSEWEYEGHKVPQLRPHTASTSESGDTGSVGGGTAGGATAPRPRARPAKLPKALPLNASAMHPCMLLTYMRPALEYRELAVEGDKPQNMLFTMGVDVDGATYIGKASNKKEARKAAARAACQALFSVQFDEVATANTPVVAAQ